VLGAGPHPGEGVGGTLPVVRTSVRFVDSAAVGVCIR
jgi:hypothetical protein